MIYTKTGDKGETSLANGQRVAKTDLRIEAYGTVDELNSWIGALRVVAEDSQLEWIQNKLFNLGAELSDAPGEWIIEKDVKQLEAWIDEIQAKLPALRAFLLPCGGEAVSRCHICRTVCRLFTYGGENRSYTPGQAHTIVNYMGFRLLLLTCYDLRFPCWSRYADKLEYDAIICVANWPSSRQSAWQLLIRARAIENQCYMIGVNRVGDDQRCHYIGASAVIDVTGHAVAQCRCGVPQALMCHIDMEELQRRREKFRVLDDRD